MTGNAFEVRPAPATTYRVGSTGVPIDVSFPAASVTTVTIINKQGFAAMTYRGAH